MILTGRMKSFKLSKVAGPYFMSQQAFKNDAQVDLYAVLKLLLLLEIRFVSV